MAAAAKPAEMSFVTVAAWAKWLAKHHATSPGIAMRIARVGGAAKSITYAQALDEALAWGWIDGQKGRGDDEAWIQRFAPRKPNSIWSKVNRAKALALIERGAMQPAGLAAVEHARANGRWDGAYDSPSKAAVPDDLGAALAKSARASKQFAALDARNRYAILHRVQTCKLAETRARRIAQFVDMLAKGELLYPPRPPRK